MKNQLIKATPKDIIGSSFVGYLQGDYDLMFSYFSFPNDRTRNDEWESKDLKTRFDWAFKTKGKKPTVITIYDYKDHRSIEGIDMWHVGCKGDRKKLQAFFDEQHLFIMPNKK